ncbi:hypothetical protein F0237_02605 [Vibrio tubiashii]|uniref:Uncharacterized protein n=1 Tax=Vibrio tubiashii TaxID=29498 RepID=A0AAE5LGS2_9VIBR|nr:hypothetical protein [Vibrio tubiashii]NOI79539.1 hypothetical protein [Vibrio tubiashii]
MYKERLLELIKCDGHIGRENTVAWSKLKATLGILFDATGWNASSRTMDKYASELKEIHFITAGRGSQVYYDGSKGNMGNTITVRYESPTLDNTYVLCLSDDKACGYI